MTSQLIRKTSLISALALSMLSIATPKSLADSYRTVTLVNKNQQNIVLTYIKTPESNNWLRLFDVAEWFGSGMSKNINFNTNQCIYDLKVIYISGSFDYGRYNFCKGNSLTYYGNGGNYDPSGRYVGARGYEYIPSWGLWYR
jgi:hypothetical protein